MNIQIRLFAVAKELMQTDSLKIELPPNATVEEVRAALADHSPQMAELVRHCMFAVDDDYVRNDAPLSNGMEVAVIPPVSGG